MHPRQLTAGREKGNEKGEMTQGNKKIPKELYDKLNETADNLSWELDFSASGVKKLENGEMTKQQLKTLQDAQDAQVKLSVSCIKVLKDEKLKAWDQYSILKKSIPDLNKNKEFLCRLV
jgi:hypothetical protein